MKKRLGTYKTYCFKQISMYETIFSGELATENISAHFASTKTAELFKQNMLQQLTEMSANASKKELNNHVCQIFKPCLQKAVRRKRPLPAVRCSMELMDKAFVEFTRRLPIIILEDSFLHPDFPFLIWIMIAASKVRNVITY